MDICVMLIMLMLGLFAAWLLYREGLLAGRTQRLAAAAFIILALTVRLWVLDYETLDYQDFLSKWVQLFRDHGGFSALKYEIGNYNIPYLYFLALFSYCDISDLYLIKLLSIFFDILLAEGAMLLLGRFTRSAARRMGIFFAVLFLPTVFLNGALWAQCDSSYAALALLGIYFALDDRPALSMVFAALAFGFKLQAVFVLPIYAVLWMYKKLRLRHFIIFPAAYIALVLPAVLLGRPFVETLTLYFNQAGSIGSGLNYNSPSVYSLFQYSLPAEYESLAATLGIIAAFIFMLAVLGICFINRHRLNDGAVIGAALLLAIGIPFFLPHMHERYFFLADVLSLLMAFISPLFSAAAVFAQFASLLGYHAYLKMRFLLLMHNGAIALIGAAILAGIFLFFTLNKKIEKN